MRERANAFSSSTAAAHRAMGGLRQRPGGTPARVRVPKCGRPLRRGHRRWPHGSCLVAGGGATSGTQSAPGGRFTRPLLAGRAARARYWARTRERRSERANSPLLTRPTVRGLPVVCSSPHAAGRRNCRAPRRLGSGWREPSPTGDSAAAGSSGAPYGGCATLRRQHPPPTPERADTRFSTPSGCRFSSERLGPCVWRHSCEIGLPNRGPHCPAPNGPRSVR